MKTNRINQKELIPRLGSIDAKERHPLDQWKLFARRIQRHPYTRNYILKRDNQTCQFCGYSINNHDSQGFHLHHIDYDHECQFNQTIELSTPTPKRPNKTSTLPDCERCKIVAPQFFDACIKRIVAVHSLCNKKIESLRLDQGEQD